MDYSKPMTIELSGQEAAVIVTGLLELPGKLTYDLLKKFEAINAETAAQAAKVPGPDLRLLSNSTVQQMFNTPE